MDYQSLLFNPIYDVIGVPATLTLSTEEEYEVTVIDKTAGIEVGGGVEVATVEPAAVVRRNEIADVALRDLYGASLEFNGGSWTVRNHLLKPSPKGEGDGEVYLILEAA